MVWLPRLLSGKESACQWRSCRIDSWIRKIPWSRKWQPTPVFLLGKSHGQRRLMDYSPWSRKRVRYNWLSNNNNNNNNKNLIQLSSILAHITVQERRSGWPSRNPPSAIFNMWLPNSPWQFSPFHPIRRCERTQDRAYGTYGASLVMEHILVTWPPLSTREL